MLARIRKLAAALLATKTRIALAESCTAGLVAATLSRLPGASNWMCGSAVTYREDTKRRWLGVSAGSLRRHGAVSDPIAREMAIGALKRTPEAALSASITGHLGPDAPPKLDGVVFIALARREGRRIVTLGVYRHQLAARNRMHRHREAASLVIEHLLDTAATTAVAKRRAR